MTIGRLKVECLRLLATLKLDPAKSELIGGFIESYLTLTDEEGRRYERAFAGLAAEEKETTMRVRTSWGEQGMHDGKEGLLVRQIRRRFGSVPPQLPSRLDQLSSDQLDELGEAFLDFSSLADLENWLARNNAQQ